MSIPDDNLIHLDFTQIFGEDQNDISLEKITTFFDECVSIASELAKVAPNQLVRVVNRNQVTWMTQEQATKLLCESNKPGIQLEVRKALKGELKTIHQELEILLALAIYTYNQYKTINALPKNDFREFEPTLKHRKHEIKVGISQTTEAETQITQKRKQIPILNEYELLMGEFLKAKDTGDTTRAAELARILGNKKKVYLLMAKSIEPEIQTLNYHRLNLQKIKKRILNTHNKLCLSRKDQLLIELKTIHEHFQIIKQEFIQIEKIAQEKAEKLITAQKKNEYKDVQNEIQQKKSELNAVSTESKIVEKQKQDCEQVIQFIAQDYIHEQKTNLSPKDPHHHPLVSKSLSPPPDNHNAPKSKRMYIRKRENKS